MAGSTFAVSMRVDVQVSCDIQVWSCVYLGTAFSAIRMQLEPFHCWLITYPSGGGALAFRNCAYVILGCIGKNVILFSPMVELLQVVMTYKVSNCFELDLQLDVPLK